jgi:CDP-paratose 2-epimerase
MRRILITGGAGFIGSNLAERLLQTPHTHVRIYDNLSRGGVTRNLAWLERMAQKGSFEFVQGDVRNLAAITAAASDVDEIYHFAAQVAVTTSLQDPLMDFQINALGTLNVLEAARLSGRKPFFLFTSTNKVYGALDSVPVIAERTRYRARDVNFRGVNESQPIDFHSPYGCSKGTADQYVRDYARIFDLPTVVFRMSCIAGPRQFGNEDQGWVAHFLYSGLGGRTITVYGDGLQVRDILHVHDLVDGMIKVRAASSVTAGKVYNLGGGIDRAVSVIEMLRAIESATGISLRLVYKDVRPGDQPIYIADTSRLERDTGWRPRRSVDQILNDIHKFWRDNQKVVAEPDLPCVPSAAVELTA